MIAGKVVEDALSKEQLDFIQTEFGHDPDALGVLDDDDIERLYDHLCDIEVEETMGAGDGELSERGKMVESIVSVIGNELYRPDDEPYPEGEDDDG